LTNLFETVGGLTWELMESKTTIVVKLLKLAKRSLPALATA